MIPVSNSRRWLLGGLGVVIACARAATPHVPSPTAPLYTESDSAAVFSAAVDHLLAQDGGRPPTPAVETDRLRPRDGRPTIFARIGSMPYGAWAAPSLARLRAWRWSYGGMAVDSMRVLADSNAPAVSRSHAIFPVELVLTLDFQGDTARVGENWIWQACKTRPGLRATFFTNHPYVRTPGGWKHTDARHAGGVADGLCP